MEPVESLNRRRFLTHTLALASTLQLQRAASALGLLAPATVCTLTAEQEVGPFYVADELVRSNIVEGKAGIPLSLRIAVLDSRTCKPLGNAAVDLWHCDALGLYSGYTSMSPRGFGPGGGPPGGPPPGFDPQHPGNRPGPPGGGGPPGGPPENHPTDKLTFLRGIQITAADGSASFHTVFPGFYMGRTNHIHFKVRWNGTLASHTYTAGHTSHVGQVFFPEELAAALMQQPPYSEHHIHRTTQREDGIFSDQHGASSMAHVVPIDPAHRIAGYRADLIASVDPTAVPGPIGRGPVGGRGGPGVPGAPPAAGAAGPARNG